MKTTISNFLFVLPVILMMVYAFVQADHNRWSFGEIPIMHDGRLKPLKTFAQITLQDLRAGESVHGEGAEDWLARTLFDPPSAAELRIFKIENKTLKTQLGLVEKTHDFSLKDIMPALNHSLPQALELSQKDPSILSQPEEALLQLHERAALYIKLLRSFSALLPLDVKAPDNDGEALNFLALSPQQKKLEQKLHAIIKKKGTDIAGYTHDEMEIAKAAFDLGQIRQGGEGNDVLRVIPVNWENAAQDWVSPWAVLLEGQGSPQTGEFMKHWARLAAAYRSEDPALWRESIADIETAAFESAPSASRTRMKAEILYKATHPYLWATAFYLAAVLALFRKSKTWAFCAGLCGIGMAVHALSIAGRIYILARPPVGTLYESVLFVSLMCAAFGLILSLLRQLPGPSGAGSLAGAALLLIAPVALPGGDSLEMLVAVLNTNFWLATHVVFITAGYGVCIFLGCLAHVALFNSDLQQKFHKLTIQISMLALFFMCVGTVLGGIWADQSWGRFWGWDPKENGALMICLWLIWAQHGRISRKLDAPAFLATLCALNIIVALSWFGVNLLNTGLHSYGFTAGLAGGLATFCTLELVAISGLMLYRKRQIP